MCSRAKAGQTLLPFDLEGGLEEQMEPVLSLKVSIMWGRVVFAEVRLKRVPLEIHRDTKVEAFHLTSRYNQLILLFNVLNVKLRE